VIKSWKIRQVGDVACTVQIKTCIKNVVRIFKAGRDYLGDIHAENKIILKLLLKKQVVRMQTRFI
jgi:hypothetical protein